MTDNQNVGAVPESGPGAQPGEPAPAQAQQPTGGDVTQLLAALESKLFGRVADLERQFLGRANALSETQGKITSSQNDLRQWLAKIDQYEKQGFSREEALAEIENDHASETRWKQVFDKLEDLAGRIAGGGTAQQNAQQFVAQALTSYGLDPKDPFVAGKLAGQTPKDATEAELLAARIFRDKQMAPQTNASQQSALPGSSQPATNAEDIARRINQLAAENPRGNMAEIQQLQKQLQQMGGR